MLYSLADVIAARQMLNRSEGAADFKFVQQRKLEALLGYCETTDCRRQVLLRYFGETLSEACGNCGTCRQACEAWDGTIVAQMALSAVYRTGQRFGAQYLTDVLVGSDNVRIKRFGHDRIKTFGVGNALAPGQWRSVFRQLMAAGYLTVDLSRRAGFQLTDKSWDVLKGEQKILFRQDVGPLKPAMRSTGVSMQRHTELDRDAQALWEELRRVRHEIARELGLPAYIVFHDKTLKEMARVRPATRTALLSISGVGEKKAARYGDRFIAAIQTWQ
jgi:ATP-dependent DNA helicase RecQ